jgi:hypothetical protein
MPGQPERTSEPGTQAQRQAESRWVIPLLESLSGSRVLREVAIGYEVAPTSMFQIRIPPARADVDQDWTLLATALRSLPPVRLDVTLADLEAASFELVETLLKPLQNRHTVRVRQLPEGEADEASSAHWSTAPAF